MLTGQEKEPALRKEWQALASQLGKVGVAAERTCKTPKYLALEVVIDPAGVVTDLQVLNYDWEPTRACLATEVARTRFPRTTPGSVKVAVTLPE